MKKFTKLTALVLTLVLVLSMIPASFAADETKGPKDDYFADGDMGDQWTILNEIKYEDMDPSRPWAYYRFEKGTGLIMPTQKASIYRHDFAKYDPAGWTNVFIMDAEGDWEVVAKSVYPKPPTESYQQTQVFAWQDEDNYIRINCQPASRGGWGAQPASPMRIEPAYEHGTIGSSTDPAFDILLGNNEMSPSTLQANADGTATLYYKINKTGNEYRLYYSTDGLTWYNGTTNGKPVTAELTNPKFGLFITQDQAHDRYTELSFEYVAVTSLNGETVRTNEEVLTWAAQNAADYIVADIPATVTEDIVLSKAPRGYTVTLTSSNPDVISADGKVNTAKGGQVELTVTLTEGATTASAKKTVTVPGAAPCEHKETEIKNAKDATCAEAGYTGDTVCKACGEKLAEGKAIPATGKHTEEVKNAKEATCTEGGYTGDTVCKVCGAELSKGKATEPAGHTWGEWTVTKQPTTEEEGEKTSTCSVCKETKTEKIAKVPAKEFADVQPSAYYCDSVYWAVVNGITTGVSESKFGPEQNCTRGQAVTFLWRAAGSPEVEGVANPFVDIKESDFYYKAVLWAVKTGVTTGLDKTHFGPGSKLTRGQFVTFLWRAKGAEEVTGAKEFKDVPAGKYCAKAVAWAVSDGITTGDASGNFAPDAKCSRAQVVTFLARAYK